MIGLKRIALFSALVGSVLGYSMSANAQAASDQAPQQQYYYGAPCMMDGFYNGAPVTSQYPVMMGFYCPYHGMYHFRPVFLSTQQQQAPQYQLAPQPAPQGVPDQPAQQGAPVQK